MSGPLDPGADHSVQVVVAAEGTLRKPHRFTERLGTHGRSSLLPRRFHVGAEQGLRQDTVEIGAGLPLREHVLHRLLFHVRQLPPGTGLVP